MVRPGKALRRAVATAVAARTINLDNVADALFGFRCEESRLREVYSMAQQVVRRFGEGRRVLRSDLERFFVEHPMFGEAFDEQPEDEELPAGMQPASGLPTSCRPPPITTLGALASWLGLHDDELSASTRPFRGDGSRAEHRQHYHYRWLPRRGSPPRLLEAPKLRLKEVQSRIANGLLRRVPVHASAHGFVKGRSVHSCAEPHVGKRCLLRLDLEDCFASVGWGRVLRTFVNVGYPEHVAAALARLCTTATPPAHLQSLAERPEARARRLVRKLRDAHLPQGAPTSPALLNLAMYRIDARLLGLARRFGAVYSRYGDDLLFSGGDAFRRDAERCSHYAAAILLAEKFDVAHSKTRIMCNSQAQRCLGLVVNERIALPRRERELLEAILHNCVRHGPDEQNRAGVADFRAHLQGRVAHAIRCGASQKLAQLFAAIRWRD